MSTSSSGPIGGAKINVPVHIPSDTHTAGVGQAPQGGATGALEGAALPPGISPQEADSYGETRLNPFALNNAGKVELSADDVFLIDEIFIKQAGIPNPVNP